MAAVEKKALLTELMALRKSDPKEFARQARALASKSTKDATRIFWKEMAKEAERALKVD